MKVSQKDFAAKAAKMAKEAKIFFFCGPDESGVHAAALKIISLLPDAGERIELAGSDLRRDPVRLGDEARSSSLFGDARHIFVRAQGDEAHDALANLIAGDVAPCPVLIVAASATDKSRSAKLLADRPDAVVGMFYPPDLSSVVSSVRDFGGTEGLRLSTDVAERIARACGLDVRLAQSEVTKLALYLDASPQAPRDADQAALDAIGAKTEEDGFMPLVNAVLNGKAQRIPAELRRMAELGLNPVGVLLAFERRAAQLIQLAAKLGRRGDIYALIESEAQARRVFWKDKTDLSTQLRIWRGARLERLGERLFALHQTLLANSQNAELLLAHELADIARAASKVAR